MTKNAWELLAVAVSFFCLVFIAGCGGKQIPVTPVSGQVTLDGAPVTGAKVVFRPEQGPAASGELDDQGRFQLTTYRRHDGAVLGQHVVTVVPVRRGALLEPGKPPQAPPPSSAPSIPDRYQQAETSTLTRAVTGDGQAVQLQLER